MTELEEKLTAENQRLRDAMLKATVGSCSCLTKTPDYKYHRDYCGYRILMEALDVKSV